jgi:hypothetical protein
LNSILQKQSCFFQPRENNFRLMDVPENIDIDSL